MQQRAALLSAGCCACVYFIYTFKRQRIYLWPLCCGLACFIITITLHIHRRPTLAHLIYRFLTAIVSSAGAKGKQSAANTLTQAHSHILYRHARWRNRKRMLMRYKGFTHPGLRPPEIWGSSCRQRQSKNHSANSLDKPFT
jgi:hypothetical protein